jgi:regulator of protease activity HflC (stomatin/prohibitin superfamily)
VGKVLTKNGYAPNTIPPSKFRLPACWFPGAVCDQLVLLEASDTAITEKMTVFMPEDKLNLTVEVRGTLAIETDPATVDSLFSRITSQPTNDWDTKMIGSRQVYMTYGEQALRGVVRSEITKYTIADIMSNREAIGQSIHAALVEKLAQTNTPIRVSRFELADLQPPQVIIDAQEAAAERDIAVQKAEADARVSMVEAERALEVAKKERLVEREKAEAIAEQNEIAAASITPQLLEYRRLEVQERVMSSLANSKNEGLIVVPLDTSSINSTTNAAIFGKVAGKEIK